MARPAEQLDSMEVAKLESLRCDFREAREEFERGEGVEMTADELRAFMRQARNPQR